MVNNAHNDPFSGKKTRKAKKKLVTRQFNIFYKRCAVKKRKPEKNARSKRNPITNDFLSSIKNAALPTKKKMG